MALRISDLIAETGIVPDSTTSPTPLLNSLGIRTVETKFKWAKIAIGGVAAAAVAVGGGLAAKGESDRADRAETVATGEAVPGQQNLDPAKISAAAFNTLTRNQQLDYAGSQSLIQTYKHRLML